MNETNEINKSTFLKELHRVLGSYRAEWARGDIFRYFTRPGYFTALEEFQPCVLQGGRGSGKTTALQGLSYEGQFALNGNDIVKFDSNVNYIGLYNKIDTNHVRAFCGANLEEKVWSRFFTHYFNLVVLLKISDFIVWHHSQRPDESVLSPQTMLRVLKTLCISSNDCNDYDQFRLLVEDGLWGFQAIINNVCSHNCTEIQLSTIGDPIKYCIACLKELPQFSNKSFYIILDEYENLEDYQQVIINTQIKHAADNYTFKIGVRELGWRQRHTLNPAEFLNDPADYVLLDINESFEGGEDFDQFAKDVCQKRFDMLLGNQSGFNIENALEELTYEEEAIRLGVEQHALMKEFDKLPPNVFRKISGLPSLYKFTIAFWAHTHGVRLQEEIGNWIRNPGAWNVRYDNYKYHMLFKINVGRGSGQLQKYYCGFKTYAKLAANNIRFFMQLIYKTFYNHIDSGMSIMDLVSAEIQTDVAKKIGEKNLVQIESEYREGVRIVRLLKGFGRVFELLAKEQESGVPEMNQFQVSDIEGNNDAYELLRVSVLNLALIRIRGNKLSGTEIKDAVYFIHPIFAPFLGFSYRRKRKMTVTSKDITGLADEPKKYVNRLLQNKDIEADQSDEQLLFKL